MPRRLIRKAEWARLHGWSKANVSRYLKAGVITERSDGLLDFVKVERQLAEHRRRPSMFRDSYSAERETWTIKKIAMQTLKAQHKIRHDLALCISRREHLELQKRLYERMRNESMNATWDIALEHCPPDGDLNGFYQALRDSLTDAFQKIDLEEFTVDPPPDWAIGFIHKYNFENEL